jgi:hypothetical protein
VLDLIAEKSANRSDLSGDLREQIVERDDPDQLAPGVHDRGTTHGPVAHALDRFTHVAVFCKNEWIRSHDIAGIQAVEIGIPVELTAQHVPVRDDPDGTRKASARLHDHDGTDVSFFHPPGALRKRFVRLQRQHLTAADFSDSHDLPSIVDVDSIAVPLQPTQEDYGGVPQTY